MEFFTTEKGPQRDHAVVRDASVVKRLDELADKAMLYRSEEQKITDHHQATGFASAGPVAFGQFEVGRSSMPQNQQYGGTFQFKATTARGIIFHHPDGCEKVMHADPGAYDPNEGSAGVVQQPEIQQVVAFTHNKSKPAFNARGERRLGDVNGHVPGKDAPGPGQYQMAKGKQYTYRTIAGFKNDFNSGSLQRPASDSLVPGPGAYTPNHDSIEAHKRDSGAQLRSTRAPYEPHLNCEALGYQAGCKSQTGADVGPGTYQDHNHKSISEKIKHYSKQQSSHKPGFGTKAPQRALPFENSLNRSVPEPGAYQPTIWTGRKVGTKVERQQ